MSDSAANPQFKVFDRQATRNLLKMPALISAIKQAATEYRDGDIVSPERMVVPRPGAGVMLSMPATAQDISVHKLVNVEPSNGQRGLPTIYGLVTIFDTPTGQPLCLLDGPEVTGSRTAAVSMIGIETFMSQAPQRVLIIGSGTQAIYHARALHEIYPEAEVFVRGLSHDAARRFCEAHAGENPNLHPCQPADIPAGTDVVIMLTTSTSPIYNEDALKGRLVIGVGAFKPEMAEIGAHTLAGSDIYVDDPLGAREEAGDLIQAGVDWGRVRNLADALQQKPPLDRPVVFKTVGTGAWDLAAGRVAIQSI